VADRTAFDRDHQSDMKDPLYRKAYETAREALLSGPVETAAYLLDEDVEAVRRVAKQGEVRRRKRIVREATGRVHTEVPVIGALNRVPAPGSDSKLA
jgi:hypothetical protein